VEWISEERELGDVKNGNRRRSEGESKKNRSKSTSPWEWLCGKVAGKGTVAGS